MNRNTEKYKFFGELEKKYDVYDLKFRNVNYWQLIRFGILRDIEYTRQLNSKTCSANPSRLSEFWGLIQNSFKFLLNVHKIKHADVLRVRPMVAFDKSGELDDHQYDYVKYPNDVSFFDLYALTLYANTDSHVKFSMALPELFVFLWKIKRKIISTQHLPNEQRIALRNLLSEINERYPISIKIDELEKEIEYIILHFKTFVKAFKFLYKIVKPKAIMVYPHYDCNCFAAVYAAKQMNIKSIEVQHGRINNHEAYCYEDLSSSGKILPDYFFTYGQWWNDNIKLPLCCKTISVGNPFLEAKSLEFPRLKQKVTTIAVISTIINGVDLYNFYCNVANYLKDKGIQVLYKLHPNEFDSWEKNYPNLKNYDNVKIIHDDTSVFEVLSKSDFVFGVNSTTFFEALVYNNLKLGIYKIHGYEQMQYLIDAGVAKTFDNESEFYSLIDETKENNNVNASSNVEFWKVNAQLNTTKELYSVIR